MRFAGRSPTSDGFDFRVKPGQLARVPMTVKSQTFEDRIAQAVEFPFFPFAFPTNYYAVGRVPYKFSFAQ
jgi:hypothetical protein